MEMRNLVTYVKMNRNFESTKINTSEASRLVTHNSIPDFAGLTNFLVMQLQAMHMMPVIYKT
jgi:hypothetical protein